MNRNVSAAGFRGAPRPAFRPAWPEREVLIRCKTAVNECMCFFGKARLRVGSDRVAGPDYGPRDARLIYGIAYRLRAVREFRWNFTRFFVGVIARYDRVHVTISYGPCAGYVSLR
jgi:hypothetical protein